MTRHTEQIDAGDGDKVIVSKSDDGNTRLFHGKGGPDGKHTTYHKDGSIWRTDSSGTHRVKEHKEDDGCSSK